MAKSINDIIDTLTAAADKVAPSMQSAFLAAVKEIRDNLVSIADIETALSTQSLEAVFAATQIEKLDPLLFGIGLDNTSYVFNTQSQVAFAAGATAAISNLVASKQKGIAFDALNERAASIMRNRGAQMISGLTQTSKDGVKSVLERIIADGVNPNKAAKEIRQLIGLTDDQAQAVLNFRRQLELRQTLGLTPPNERRLNAIEQAKIRRHMKEGHFTTQNIDDMVERYYQSMLNKRARDIARTESMSAVNAGQNELWVQGLDLGILNDDEDRKFWIVTPDDRLRATHAAIPNMNPFGVKIRSYFITPFGLVFSPGDYNVNLINCRCCLVLGSVGQTF